MKKKGLTITIIFLAESANYGESIGNVATLKKISRNRGEQYTYISRQAIRYNIIDQLEEKKSPVSKEKGVFQFKDEALISDYPELDFFGYMKTGKSTVTRSAVVRKVYRIDIIKKIKNKKNIMILHSLKYINLIISIQLL